MIRRHLTAALIFLLLTLIMTNPLALHVWNAVEDKQDGLLNTWIVAWVGHALVTEPLNLFNTNIFYPYQNTLAYSEVLLPPSLVALPLTLATHNPIFGYNVSLFAMLWLDAFGMYLLVYDWTRRAEAGWIAGVIYAFSPFNLGNFAQMQLLTLGFLPLAILFLGKLGRAGQRGGERSLRRATFAFLFALFFVLQALSSFYYAMLAGFAVAAYCVWWLMVERGHLRAKLAGVMLPFAGACLVAGLALLPFLLPYFAVQRELGFSRRVQESEPFSASLKQFTEVAPQNVIYGKWLAPNPVKRVGGYPLDNLFPGIAVLVLAIVGVTVARAREKLFILALLMISFVLALGPRLYLTSQVATDIVLPYRWLYDIFPPLRALRAPVRFDALIQFALAVLAGGGAAYTTDRFARAGIKSGWIALGIVGVVSAEYLAYPAANIVSLPVANEIPAVYKWLAQQAHSVALELPMMGPNDKNELDISAQYFSTYHWQDTPDGYSGFIPPRRGEIAYEMAGWPSLRSIALLRALDVNWLIDHTPRAQCLVWSGPVGFIKPRNESKIEDTCIYQIPPRDGVPPVLEKSLYVPSTVAVGAPFVGYMILVNRNVSAFAVKPTDLLSAEAHWSNGTVQALSFPLPLVTSSVSVVPISLTAPAQAGEFKLGIKSSNSLVGKIEIAAQANVGNELAREVVLPASVKLSKRLEKEYLRGGTVDVALRWMPHNKINAYYSASVRLVNDKGEKVANTDRQPVVATLLWKPEQQVEDEFRLPIPNDVPSGKYRVEVMMYQADTDVSALLLDGNFEPQASIELGEIEVR